MSYILVTTVRNEAKNLPKLIDSVANQSIRPVFWFIMNDNSSDDTESILLKASQKYSYIEYYNMEGGDRDLAWRYHANMSFGFNEAVKMSQNKGLNWNYIGILDGDIILDSIDYYEKLIKYLKCDLELAIISGIILSYNGKKYIDETHFRSDMPRGANRLIKKSFYEKFGYPIVPCADSVMRVLAIQNNYKCLCVNDAIAKQSRLTTSENSDINSGKYLGKVKYILGYPLAYCILKTIYYLMKLKPLLGIGFFSSYIKYYFGGEKRIEIESVRKYYRKKIIGV